MVNKLQPSPALSNASAQMSAGCSSHCQVTGVVLVAVQWSPACGNQVAVEGRLVQPPVDCIVGTAHPQREAGAAADIRRVAPAAGVAQRHVSYTVGQGGPGGTVCPAAGRAGGQAGWSWLLAVAHVVLRCSASAPQPWRLATTWWWQVLWMTHSRCLTAASEGLAKRASALQILCLQLAG